MRGRKRSSHKTIIIIFGDATRYPFGRTLFTNFIRCHVIRLHMTESHNTIHIHNHEHRYPPAASLMAHKCFLRHSHTSDIRHHPSARTHTAHQSQNAQRRTHFAITSLAHRVRFWRRAINACPEHRQITRKTKRAFSHSFVVVFFWLNRWNRTTISHPNEFQQRKFRDQKRKAHTGTRWRIPLEWEK